MVNVFNRLALKTALTYGVVAGLWISFSDWLLVALVHDVERVARWSVVKGWCFVGLTAVLLYAMLRRGMLRLQRETEARVESETRFRQVVESIDEVFWMVDAQENRKLYVSPAYEEIWGRPSAPLYQNSMAWVDAVFQEDQARVRAALATRLHDGTFDEEFRIVRPDGSIRWIRDRAYPVKDASGKIERIVGVAEDITERKQLEAKFLRAQRLEAVGTLAGGVAHDLNNILAPMLMAAGLLKETAATERDREMLTMVERSAQRGAEIIRQLLTFSRGIEGARMPLQARHLLKEIGEIIRETFPREIELVETTPRDLWPVVADATQLHQVLMNLCVNARDAMPRGGKLWMAAENRTLTEIDVRERNDAKPGRYVKLSVADSGTGISPENIRRLFEPFFTTKDVGRGTGLGLATVLGIVRSHGGFVAVQSEMGLGSTFDVYLPAFLSELDEGAVVSENPVPDGNGELVLVVDDEEAIREATRHVLEQHGYRVLAAANGRVAVDLFLEQKDQIRLVITDIMMPEMGGAALVKALHVLSPKLKVIATSGLEPDEKREELIGLGVSEMLMKPCAARVLAEAVHRQFKGD